MTSAPEHAREGELLACPHCGESLVQHTDHHGSWWAHRNEPASCAHGVTQLFTKDDFDEWNRRAPTNPELRDALIDLLHEYVQLAESGDCGFWDVDKIPHVIKARAALAERTVE